MSKCLLSMKQNRAWIKGWSAIFWQIVLLKNAVSMQRQNCPCNISILQMLTVIKSLFSKEKPSLIQNNQTLCQTTNSSTITEVYGPRLPAIRAPVTKNITDFFFFILFFPMFHVLMFFQCFNFLNYFFSNYSAVLKEK